MPHHSAPTIVTGSARCALRKNPCGFGASRAQDSLGLTASEKGANGHGERILDPRKGLAAVMNIRWHSMPSAVFLTACVLTGIAQESGLAQGEPVWSHESGSGAENWNANVVSIGDHGTQVLTSYGSFTDFTRLFSVFDQSPPSPVWQDAGTVTTQRHRVASAEEADVHATLHDIDSGSAFNTRNVLVHKYSSASSTADWTYTFPEITNGHEATAVHVSKDGQRIVAMMHNIYQNETDIAVFGPDSGVPTHFYSIGLNTPMVANLLSADGSTIYLRSNTKVVLFDLNTGLIRHENIVFGGVPYSDAIAGDGSVYAYSTYTNIKVYREVAGEFVDPEVITVPGDNYCAQLGISDDGSILALGFNYYDQWLRVRVQARSLVTGDVLLDESLQGGGSLQNLISALSLSADGERLAIGLWGDEDDLVPEVSVYSTSEGMQIASFETPGSVNSVDFSDDGSKLVVASKKTHANTVASGGRIDLYHIGSRDFQMTGVPRVGSTVQFTFKARTGKKAVLFSSPALASSPIFIPVLGTMELDDTQISSTPMGIVGAGDTITSDFVIPNDPALIGTTIYFQGFASAPRELSKSWVAMTILP